MQQNVQSPTDSAAAHGHVPSTDLISDSGVKLLDTIDDLRRLGIDKDIPLPQIVVVGAQSSGKSSVLEAISGISFPVNDGQCTTFASEIKLRRSKEEKIAINIVSNNPRRPGEEKLHPLNVSNDNSDDKTKNLAWDQMPRIINQAAKAMSTGNGQKFCEDKLRIEVSGPTQDHLSLIDLPGIFHVLKPGQDPLAPERVKETVLRYMKEERSIILAVVSAKDDYASQEILKTVERIDPSGIRTMGIITGIDMTPKGSVTERDYIALARNELVTLQLGWHVVRNLSFEDRQTATPDRDALERRFFEERDAWRSIPEQDRGAPQLKKKLSETLLAHIGRELSGVIRALERKIEDNKEVLKQLGQERSNNIERRNYLAEIGKEHQRLISEALDGIYDNAFFGLTHERLRAKVVQEFDLFEKAMLSGHRWDFWTLPDDGFPDQNTPSIGEAQYSESYDAPYKIRREDYLAKVDAVRQWERGPELHGHFAPRLVKTLFTDQSSRWETIAKEALEKIVKILKTFLVKVTKHLVEPRRAQLLLERKIIPTLQAREQVVNLKLEELLKPFKIGHPRTHNPHYQASLQRLEKAALTTKAPNAVPPAVLGDRPACEKLTISLQSYYTVARSTFVDNVINLGIEFCLLDGLADILDPVLIVRMTDQQIDELASEFPQDAMKRQRALRDLEKLRAGLEVCREYDRQDIQTLSVPSSPLEFEKSPPTFKLPSPSPNRTPLFSNTDLRRSRSPSYRLRSSEVESSDDEL